MEMVANQLARYYEPNILYDLQYIIKRHRSVIEDAWSDIYEYDAAYVLDFQEIYNYIFPYRVDSEEAAIVNYVLSNLTAPILLLPGTWLELLHRLKKILKNAQRVEEAVSQLSEHAGAETIEKAVMFIREDIDDISRHIQFDAELEGLSRALIEALGKYEFTLHRLLSLLSKPNHVGLDFFTQGQDTEIDIDVNLFRRFEKALNGLREDRPFNNQADAANLAGIVAIRNYVSEANLNTVKKRLPRVYLLSHTSPLLDLNSWAIDQHYTNYKLTRTPEEVMYHILLQDATRDNSMLRHKLEICSRALSTVQTAIETFDELRGDRTAIESGTGLTDKTQDKQMVLSRRLVTSATAKVNKLYEVGEFIDYVHDDFVRNATTIVRRDAILALNKRISFGEGGKDKKITNSILGTGLMTLWNDIQSESRLKKLKDVNMKSKEEALPNVNGYRFKIIFRGTHDFVFALENYTTHYSAYWPTRYNLRDFLEFIERFTNQMMSQKARKKKSAFKARLYLITNKQLYERVVALERLGRVPLPSLIPFDASGDRHEEMPRYIRIATNWGDFCYDIIPRNLQQDNFVGFISKYRLTDTLCEMFFYSSNHPTLITSILKKKIEKHLENFESTVDETTKSFSEMVKLIR